MAGKFLGPLDLANKIIAKKYKHAKSWKGDVENKKAQTDWTKRRDMNNLLDDDDISQFEEWEVDDPEVVDIMQEMDALTSEVYDLIESDPVLYEEVLKIAQSYLGSNLDPSIAEANAKELIADMIKNTNDVSAFISEDELNKVDWDGLTDRLIYDYHSKEGS